MFKKMFALASVTALAGLVATVAVSGCSSTTSGGDESDAATTPDATKKPPIEAGPTDDDAGPGTCPTTDTIDVTTAPYESPVVVANACTEADVAALVKVVDDKQDAVTDADLLAAIPAGACHDCVFAKDDGTHWGPLATDSTGAKVTLINTPSCIGIVSGSEACGKAWTQFSECLDAACQDCPTGDQAGLSACHTAAGQGACNGGVAAVQTNCPDLQANGEVCDKLSTKYAFEVPVRAQCIGLTPVDGGADAGDGG